MTKIDMADTRQKAAALADRAADALRPPKPKRQGRIAALILAMLFLTVSAVVVTALLSFSSTSSSAI